MYRVKVISHFSAAHYLRNYKGKCENLHGHNWKVEVILEGEKLNSLGLLVDFGEVKKILNSCLKELDHKLINKLGYFRKHNPSSENISFYIFSYFKKRIRNLPCRIKETRVWETSTSCAIYEE